MSLSISRARLTKRGNMKDGWQESCNISRLCDSARTGSGDNRGGGGGGGEGLRNRESPNDPNDE